MRRGPMGRALALAAAFCVAAAGGALAQTADGRGLVRVPIAASEAPGAPVVETRALYASSHALVIGIDDYDSGWPRLRNAIADAEAVATSLEAKGFEVQLETDLRGRALRQVIERFVFQKGRDEDARLLIWFAGHGHTEQIGQRELAYLVPADAPGPEAGAAFDAAVYPLADFVTTLSRARAHHVLAVFDSCFSGAVFDTRASGQPPAAITRATAERVRQMISSGERGQLVSDDGAFRQVFLNALDGRDPVADANRDGFLTGSELGFYLSDKVTNYSQGAQTPRYGKARFPGDDLGDFVFALGAPAPEAAPEADPEPETAAQAVAAAEPAADCAGPAERLAFERAVRAESLTALDAFLAAFPESCLAGPAAGLRAVLAATAPQTRPQDAPEKPPEAGTAGAASEQPPVALDPAWEAVRDSRNVSDLIRYRRENPGGRHDAAATEAIAALREDYRAAQRELQRLRLYSGEIDGRWGTGSVAAMERWELEAGREPDALPQREELALLAATETPPEPEGFWARLTAQPQGGALKECDVCPAMVAIPGGTYTMGSPETEPGRVESEGPQQQVTIQPFAMGVYEVTFEEWDACAADGFCTSNPSPDDLGWGRGDRPVINVFWDDVTGERGFLAWLNSRPGVEDAPYRLPTEAEWEYAARAGTSTPFWSGATISPSQANYNGGHAYNGGPTGEYRGRSLPVGSFQRNRFGLYDVHGNLWEWVQDCWTGRLDASLRDGSARMSGDCSRAVLRGGSWNDPPRFLRSAFRLWLPREIRNIIIGFRLARTAGD